MKKKLLTIVLTMVMVLGLFSGSASVFAEDYDYSFTEGYDESTNDKGSENTSTYDSSYTVDQKTEDKSAASSNAGTDSNPVAAEEIAAVSNSIAGIRNTIPAYVEIGKEIEIELDTKKKNVSWKILETSPQDVVEITQTGKKNSDDGEIHYARILAKKAGVTTIVATSKDEKFTVSMDINVVKPLKFNNAPSVMGVGDANPFNTNDSNWSFSNLAYDKEYFDSFNDTLVSKKAGNTQVTYTDQYGRVKTKDVKIVSLVINDLTKVITPDMKYQMVATGELHDTNNLVWSSGDSSIAEITDSGLLTAKAEGTVTISVKDKTNDISVTKDVTVVKKIDVTLDKGNILVGDSILPVTSEDENFNPNSTNIEWKYDTKFFDLVQGRLVAQKVGTTKITATKNGQTATIEITIHEFNLDLAQTEIDEGQKIKVKVDASAGLTDFKFESTDTNVATINKNGAITAIADGKTTITVTNENYGFVKTVDVTVRGTSKFTSLPEFLEKGQSIVLKATNVTHVNLLGGLGRLIENTFKITSGDCLELTGNVLTAVKGGTGTVSYTDKYGRTIEAEVKVRSIEIDNSIEGLITGNTHKLQISGSHYDASNLKYTSSDKSVAKINTNGKITSLKAGEVIITVKDATYNLEATMNLKVTDTLMIENVSENIGLNSRINPTTSTGLEFKRDRTGWEYDPSFFDMDNGELVAKQNGQTTISVTQDGQTAAVLVNIHNFNISTDKSIISVGDTAQVNITDATADFGGFTYASSNPKVAKVNKNGVVTGVATGVVTITVKDNVYGIDRTIEIKVREVSKFIDLPEYLNMGDDVVLKATNSNEVRTLSMLFGNTFKVIAGDCLEIKGNVLTAVKGGEGTIAYTDIYGDTISAVVKVRSIAVSNPVSGMIVGGDTHKLSIEGTYHDTNNIGIESLDNDVIAVSGYTLTAINEGTATIKVTDWTNKLSTTMEVKVSAKLELKDIPENMGVRDVFRPTTSTNLSFSSTSGAWSYDGEYFDVADGKLVAKKTGETTISVIENGQEARVTINIHDFELSTKPEYVDVDNTLKIEVVKSPGIDGFTYASSDSTIAKVNKKGVVTGVADGVVTIKVTDNKFGIVRKIDIVVRGESKFIDLPEYLNVGESANVKATNTLPKTVFNVTGDSLKVVGTDSLQAIRGGEGFVSYTDKYGRVIESEVKVRSIEFVDPSLRMIAGSTQQLVVTGTHYDPANLTYKSQKDTVATVSSTGEITAVGKGNTTITVTDKSNQISATIELKVANKLEIVNISSTDIGVGDSISPESTAGDIFSTNNVGAVWKYDSVYFRVEGSSLVAIKDGSTEIIVTRNGQEAKVTINIHDFKLSTKPEYVDVNNTLKIEIDKSTGIDGFTYASSDPTIAKVNKNGVVTGVADGVVTIKVTDNKFGIVRKIDIVVRGESKFIDLPEYLNVGETANVKATNTLPKTAFNVTGDSITVDNGLDGSIIKAVKGGFATISYIDKYDREISAEIKVYEMFIENIPAYIEVGNKHNLSLNKPDDLTNIEWKSSDTTIASVNAKGIVSAKAAGSVTITATDTVTKTTTSVTIVILDVLQFIDLPLYMSVDQQFEVNTNYQGEVTSYSYDMFRKQFANVYRVTDYGTGKIVFQDIYGRIIEQNIKVGNFEFTNVPQYLEVGSSSYILEVQKTHPEMDIKFTSNNSEIARVSETGEVIALKPGTVEITAKEETFGIEKKTNILVVAPLEVNIPTDMNVGDTVVLQPNYVGEEGLGEVTIYGDQLIFDGTTLSAVNVGEVNVRYTDTLGRTVETMVTVRDLTFADHQGYVEIGGQPLQLELVKSHEDLSTIVYTSLGTGKVEITTDGKVTGLEEGIVEIVAKNPKFGTEARTTIEVVYPLDIDGFQEHLNLGSVVHPKPNYGTMARVDTRSAADARFTGTKYEGIKYDPGYFLVSVNGEFTAIKSGTTVIEYTDYLGREFRLEVIIHEINLTITKPYVEINGNNLNINVINKVDDGLEHTYKYESSDELFAVVDENGLVVGKKEGTVTITVTDVVFNTKKTIDVLVVPKLGIAGVPKNRTVYVGDAIELIPSYGAEKENAAWEWNGDNFTARFSPATFKALRSTVQEGSDTDYITFIKYTDKLGRTANIPLRIVPKPAPAKGNGADAGKGDANGSGTNKNGAVNTADNTNIGLWASMLGLSLLKIVSKRKYITNK